MKLLVMDTSCKTAMAAVCEDGSVLASIQIQDQKTHSVKLLPAVEYILAAAGVSPSELGLVAVTNGPGSYTGLRIGVTTAKAFAYSLGIPLIGLNTLEALAAACAVGEEQLVCPMIDARNARVYAALYRGSAELLSCRALSCETLCETLRTECAGERILFTGDGTAANGALLTDLLGEMYRPLPSELSAGNPAAIALLAREKYAAAEAAGVIGEYTAERLKVEYYKNYTDSI